VSFSMEQPSNRWLSFGRVCDAIPLMDFRSTSILVPYNNTSPPAGGLTPSPTEPVITEQDLQTHDEHPPEPKSGGEQIETITTHSPEANACQQPSETEGSWQTQRKIGRRLRGARGAGRCRKIGQRLRGTRGAGKCRGRLVRGSREPGELPGLSASQV
jgi:hypothetical protein